MTTNATTAIWAEVWPFHAIFIGQNFKLLADRFYGFGDAGGLAGSFDGYTSREEAVKAIKAEYGIDEIGTEPDHLGDYATSVLSGREFIDRIYTIGEDDVSFLFDYGYWDNMTEREAETLREDFFQYMRSTDHPSDPS
jgi:hypothetical protein